MNNQDLISISTFGYWTSSSLEEYVDTFGWQFFGSRINLQSYYSSITLSKILDSDIENTIKLSSTIEGKTILDSKITDKVVLTSRQI